MKTASVEYLGELRTQAQHLKSGNQLTTDAPTDNNGKGEAFSPTDLLATSLLSCMITIIGIKAEQHGLNIRAMNGSLKKEMTSNPRRVKSITIWLVVSGQFSEKEKTLLYNSAINCPVAKSLHPDIDQVVHLDFED